jgi:general stress protein YciG
MADMNPTQEDTKNDESMMKKQHPAERSHMTRQKAGQRGGLTTAKRHGKEFYERIGRKGGQSRKKRERDGATV